MWCSCTCGGREGYLDGAGLGAVGVAVQLGDLV